MSRALDLAKQFAELDLRRKALEADVKSVKAEIAEILGEAVEAMTEEGVPKVTVIVDGKPIGVRIQRDLRASAKDHHEEAIAALRSLGMHDFINETAHSGSLGAYVRRLEKEDPDADGPLSPEQVNELLPEPLRGLLTISEVFDLRTF